MVLVVVLSWVAALVVALVVLGFCGYEVTWKARRLTHDLEQLRRAQADLTTLRDRLATLALPGMARSPKR